MTCELVGELNIGAIAQIKAQFLSVLEPGTALSVDTRKVTEVDTAGMQLLLAALTTAVGKGIAVLYPVEQRGAAVQEALRCFGLADQDWTQITARV
jgi:ABC-type transporter Mla MlaB component